MCLNLSKPDIWVSGPEWGKLNAHCSDIRAKRLCSTKGGLSSLIVKGSMDHKWWEWTEVMEVLCLD